VEHPKKRKKKKVMEIKWIRSSEKVSFSHPYVWFVLGVRGCGKSSFLETIGAYHAKKNHVLMDLYGSRDGEGLSWLRSPFVEDKKVLLTTSEAASVDCSWETKSASKVTLRDLEFYDFIISSGPLYTSPADEYTNLGLLTDLIGKRAQTGWKRLIYCIVRECSSLYYSRLKRTENQILAKAEMIFTIRESRHSGLSLGLDTLRFTGVDIELRELADFVIIKRVGMFGLPKDLKWMYSIFQPFAFRRMPAKNFYILSKEGSVGAGVFKSFSWHKKEREPLLKQLGIKVEFGELEHEGEYRGIYQTVSDSEHSQIIEMYVEEGLSMGKIAKKLGRSSKVPHSHIHSHNSKVLSSGFCPECRRVKSNLDNVMAKRMEKNNT
jgi:hypothetical protein